MNYIQSRVLLAILVATVSLIIFFSGTAISQEVPVEEKTSTLEPFVDKYSIEKLEDKPIKIYAKSLVISEWGISEWESFDTLIHKESSWNHKAQNPTSTAFGLGQFLNSTWSTVGCVKTEDAYIQIQCTIKYINQRYDTPTKALDFHKLNNWY